MIQADGTPTIAWPKRPMTADHEDPRNPWAEPRAPGLRRKRRRLRLISKISRRRNQLRGG